MGPVKSVKVVTDQDTGQSKCFGFVEMESRDEGQRALDEMNGREYAGCLLVVKEAEERSDPSRPGGSREAIQPYWGSPFKSACARPEVVLRGRWTWGRWLFFAGQEAGGQEEKVTRNKPDKYSDGPRQTKMKKPKAERAQNWADFDDDY